MAQPALSLSRRTIFRSMASILTRNSSIASPERRRRPDPFEALVPARGLRRPMTSPPQRHAQRGAELLDPPLQGGRAGVLLDQTDQSTSDHDPVGVRRDHRGLLRMAD